MNYHASCELVTIAEPKEVECLYKERVSVEEHSCFH